MTKPAGNLHQYSLREKVQCASTRVPAVNSTTWSTHTKSAVASRWSPAASEAAATERPESGGGTRDARPKAARTTPSPSKGAISCLNPAATPIANSIKPANADSAALRASNATIIIPAYTAAKPSAANAAASNGPAV